MKKRRLLVTLTSMLFATTLLASCGQTTVPSGTATSVAPKESSAAAEEKKESPSPETETLSPMNMTLKLYHAVTTGNENYAETPVGQYIKEKMNISIELLPSTGQNADVITDFAAGLVPDLFNFWITPNNFEMVNAVKKAAQEGLLADLTEGTAKSPFMSRMAAPERLPLFQKEVIYSQDFGGKLYAFSLNHPIYSPWVSGWGIYIRGDVAEALDIPTPSKFNNKEEFYDLLVKIKNAGFKDINGREVYPLGLMQQWPQLAASINKPFDFGGVASIGLENGKITGFIESQYAKDQVLWVRKLLKDGLLDPESYTQKFEIGTEKIAQARYAVTPFFGVFAQPDGTDYMKSLTDAHPEKALKPLGILPNYQGSQVNTINKGMAASQAFAVSAKTDAARVMQLVEFFASDREARATASYGPYGTNWEWTADDFAKMKDDVYKELQADTEWHKKMGTRIMDNFAGVTGSDDPEFDVFGGGGKDWTRAFYQNNKAKADNIDAYVAAIFPEVEVINKLNIDYLLQDYPQKDIIQPVFDKLKDWAASDNILPSCYLAKSDEEALKLLDSFVDTLNKNGYQEFLAYLQEMYDKDPDRYATYVTNVQ